jgi:hypothetical protein
VLVRREFYLRKNTGILSRVLDAQSPTTCLAVSPCSSGLWKVARSPS